VPILPFYCWISNAVGAARAQGKQARTPSPPSPTPHPPPRTPLPHPPTHPRHQNPAGGLNLEPTRRGRPTSPVMSSKKRRRQAAQADEVEAWLRETEASLHAGSAGGGGGDESQPASSSAPRAPKWPAACRPLAESFCAGACGVSGVATGLAALRALRLSLSLGVGSPEWRVWAEQRLEESLCRPPVIPGASPDVKSYHSESRAARNAPGGAAVSLLRQLCALDRLEAVLWDVARRSAGPPPVLLAQKGASTGTPPALSGAAASAGPPPVLPAVVAEAAAAAHLATCDEGAATARRVLAAIPGVATTWGARTEWLEREEGPPWREGACALLRLMRARWVECVCHAFRMGSNTDPKRAQAAVLRWQLAGRDIGARFFSFSVPGSKALRCLAGLAAEGAVVELGAHNGHWAACVEKRAEALRRAGGAAEQTIRAGTGERGRGQAADAHSKRQRNVDGGANANAKTNTEGGEHPGDPPHPAVLALDISPPPPPPRQPLPIAPGTASSLPSLPHQTLFLCMPSPGEEALAEGALAAFTGSYVAYVGEWGTGMTGTRIFHAQLISGAWEMTSRLPVPNWPLMHVELFVFRRKRGAGEGGGHTAGVQAGGNTAGVQAGGNTAGAGMKIAKQARRQDVKNKRRGAEDKTGENTAGEGPGKPIGEQALVRCAGCGGQATSRCPLTRQMCLCPSAACYAATAGAHAALLELGFCGLGGVVRPLWGEWERCKWLGEESASKREWLALARATPHAEGGFGLNWSQP
jgi:hypothetical protein